MMTLFRLVTIFLILAVTVSRISAGKKVTATKSRREVVFQHIDKVATDSFQDVADSMAKDVGLFSLFSASEVSKHFQLHLEGEAPTFSPTQAPTEELVVPTEEPSEEPTFEPTEEPTFEPSEVPTDIPTSVPTSLPTSVPTSRPSSKPSGQPTSRPTGQPSSQPSAAPTGQPTSMPSMQPSGQPSSQPSSKPTAPTFRPTFQPYAPSAAPTVLVTVTFKIGTTYTFGFVAGNSLESISEDTIYETVAAVAPANSTFEIVSFYIKSSRRRLDVGSTPSIRGNNDLSDLSTVTYYTYGTDVNYFFNMINFPGQTVDQAINSQNNFILTVGKNGTFQKTLRKIAVKNNATQLLNTTVENVNTSSTITNVPTTSSNRSARLTDGQIAGLVIGIVFGILILLGIVYYFVVYRREHTKFEPQQQNDAVARGPGGDVESFYYADTITIDFGDDSKPGSANTGTRNNQNETQVANQQTQIAL